MLKSHDEEYADHKVACVALDAKQAMGMASVFHHHKLVFDHRLTPIESSKIYLHQL